MTNTPIKTHYLGIIFSIVNAVILGQQAQTGIAVNLTDPTVWTQFLAVIYTIYGFIRNPPSQ